MAIKRKDGVTFEPNGDVLVVARGKPYRLENPEMGVFGKIRDELTGNLDRLKEETGKTAEELQVGIGLLDDPKAMERAKELAADVMALTFELSGVPLPEDRGTWPVWLFEDQGLLGKILAHWRTTPLGSG